MYARLWRARDGLALQKTSRRIVNVTTAPIAAAMNRLWKRAARRFYPVCCGSHRKFCELDIRGILQGPPKNEENGKAGYHELSGF